MSFEVTTSGGGYYSSAGQGLASLKMGEKAASTGKDDLEPLPCQSDCGHYGFLSPSLAIQRILISTVTMQNVTSLISTVTM